jgi:hypothetical protein
MISDDQEITLDGVVYLPKVLARKVVVRGGSVDYLNPYESYEEWGVYPGEIQSIEGLVWVRYQKRSDVSICPKVIQCSPHASRSVSPSLAAFDPVTKQEKELFERAKKDVEERMAKFKEDLMNMQVYTNVKILINREPIQNLKVEIVRKS